MMWSLDLEMTQKPKWNLKKTVQCDKCPWKVTTNPLTIPDGYSLKKHQGLKSTISDGSWQEILIDQPLQAMACHEGRTDFCVGWIHNQLNQGNNIRLRIRMASCSNLNRLEIVGEQHKKWEDTLPKI